MYPLPEFKETKLHPASFTARLTTILLTCLFCTFLACRDDRQESFYPSLADAKRDGAIDRGWIPEFLPQSSRSIHELHDLSPSRGWCAFEFLPADAVTLNKALKATVDTVPPPIKQIRSAGRPWWPAMLEGDLDMKKLRASGFQLYAFVDGSPPVATVMFFAIDWAKGIGFLYQTPQPS